MQVYNEKTNQRKLLSRRMFDEQARGEKNNMDRKKCILLSALIEHRSYREEKKWIKV